MQDTTPIGAEVCEDSKRGQTKQVIKSKLSKQGCWGHEKSKAMHSNLVQAIEAKNERASNQRESRKEKRKAA